MSLTGVDWIDGYLSRAPEGVVELAKLLSPAVVVDRALVRRIRRSLLPDLPASAEADLWFSPLVQAHTASRITFSVPAAVELRRRLAVDWLAGRHAELEEARRIFADVHVNLAPPLLLEEEMAWDLVVGDFTAASERWDKAIAGYLRDPDEFRFWLVQAEARIGDVVSTTRRGAVVGRAAAGDTITGPSWEAMYGSLPTRALTVAHVGPMLELGGPVRPGTRRIEVPDLATLPLEASWRDPDGPRAERVTIAGAPVRIHAPGPVEIRTPAGATYTVRDDPYVRPVRVAPAADPDGAVADMVSAGDVAGARLADPDEEPEITIDLTGDAIVLLREGGVPLAGVPAIDRRDADRTSRLASILAHVSRWLAVDEFRIESQLLAGALEVQVARLGEPPAGSVDVAAGEELVATVINNSVEWLTVSLFMIASDWTVTPTDGPAVQVEPGGRWEYRFRPAWAELGPPAVFGRIVAVGARHPFDLRPLALGPVDRGLFVARPNARGEGPPSGLNAEIEALAGTDRALGERYEEWVTAEAVVRATSAVAAVPERRLVGHVGPVNTVAFSRADDLIATGGSDGTIRLWHRSGWAAAVLGTGGAPVNSVAFAPDERFLASAGNDGVVRLWTVGNREQLQAMQGHTGPVNAVAFAGSRMVVSAGADGSVCWWEMWTGGLRTRDAGKGPVTALAGSPDGTLAWRNGPIIQLSNERGEQSAVLPVDVVALAFSPDGERLVSVSVDGAVDLWDLGPAEIEWTRQSSGVNAVAFSPDGTVVASAGGSGSVDLIDVATGSLRTSFDGNDGGVNAVAFSPDGLLLASAGAQGEVRLWSVPQPQATVGTDLAGSRVILAIAAPAAPGLPPLPGVERDVEVLIDELPDLGFDRVVRLSSGAEIRSWFAGLADHLAAGGDMADMLVAYFAGHGETTAAGSVNLILQEGERFDIRDARVLASATGRLVVMMDVEARGAIPLPDFLDPGGREISVAMLSPSDAIRAGAFVKPVLDALATEPVLGPTFVDALRARTGADLVSLQTSGAPISFAPSALRVELLPAGRGASVLVRCGPQGNEWRLLFDAGPASAGPRVRGRLRDLLGAHPRLDLLIGSHADEGAIGGLGPLLEEAAVRVGEIWFNRPEHSHRPSERLLGAVEVTGLEARRALAADRAIVFPGGIRVIVLAPSPAGDARPDPAGSQPTEPSPEATPTPSDGDDDLAVLAARSTVVDRDPQNRQSIALLVEHDGVSVLLPGDLTPDRLEQAVRRVAAARGSRRLHIDVVVVPHRGARSSVTTSLVDAIDCRDWMFPSDGDRFRHPHPESVARIITGTAGARLHFTYRSEVTARWESKSLQERYGFEAIYPTGDSAGIAVEIVPAWSAPGVNRRK
jgi:beta-lactamase superfamily II metal-dependent hydrolase